MDPVREARVRRMVPDMTTWPGPYICMKRIAEGRSRSSPYDAFGMIRQYEPGQPIVVVLTTLTLLPGEDAEEAWVYQDLDSLVAAGWAVD